MKPKSSGKIRPELWDSQAGGSTWFDAALPYLTWDGRVQGQAVSGEMPMICWDAHRTNAPFHQDIEVG
jgi:hypothetical protein